jgi:DNA helicase-2/ATP-dependent DNA helicase PcrA
MIQRYSALALHVPVGELLEKLLEETGVIDALRDEGPEGLDRIENVRELVASAHEFSEADAAEDEPEDDTGASALDRYLQKISLLTDVDRYDADADAVTLMTVHNAKGLEYPVVFIGGLEDGLFPLARAFDEPDTLEEERRLFYVGITRAQDKLYLTHARSRRRAGEIVSCIPSSFLRPIPPRLVDSTETDALRRIRTQWGTPRRSRSREYGAGSRRSTPFEDDSGVYIDYSEAQDVPRFVKGERVRHPQFGRGTIRELSGFGVELKAVIDFDGAGRKKVVLKYANLQKEL